MPEIKSCPTCNGNAYSTPLMSGPKWTAVPGRSEVARLASELMNKEEYVEILENRVKSYQDTFNWHTTCSKCAQLLDDSFKKYCETEILREKFVKLREVLFIIQQWDMLNPPPNDGGDHKWLKDLVDEALKTTGDK